MTNTKQYWFPAKRYGWGWGMPSCWQGWCVLAAYVVGIALLAFLYPPASDDSQVFFAGLIGLSVVLVAVCWFKGEPPRWRWGDDHLK